MPEGWELALEGFRWLGLRWWRRNLLKTFRRWRQQTVPLTKSERRENRKIAQTVHQGVSGRYAWNLGGGPFAQNTHNSSGTPRWLRGLWRWQPAA